MLSNNELRRGREMNVFSAFSFIWMKPIVKKKNHKKRRFWVMNGKLFMTFWKEK